MPLHGPAHHDFSCEDFVKEDMLFKRTKNEKEAPVAQSLMSKATAYAATERPCQTLLRSSEWENASSGLIVERAFAF
jgi:hypothetical protein